MKRTLLLTVLFACIALQSVTAFAQDGEGPVEGPVGEGPVGEGPADEEGPMEEGPTEEGPTEEGPTEKPTPTPEEIDQQSRVTNPTLIQESAQPAEYPKEALEKGIKTTVVMEIDIDVDGNVTDVRVITPSPEKGYGFDEAAVAALRQFKFTPAKYDGKPIPVTFAYTYKFTFEERPVDPVETPDGKEAPKVLNYTGLALERGTRNPLPGALVTIFRKDDEGNTIGFEDTTDKEGRFNFYDLSPGEWKILIDPPGYFPFRTAEQVVDGKQTDVVYFVEKGAYNKFDVLVEAAKPRKEVNLRVIKVAEIERIPGNFGDAIKVVQNLPSVARTPFGSGDIIVRGSSPEDTKVYIDGIAVPIIFHFGGLRSVVPTGVLDGIKFEPGNFTSYYGRALGGMLDVDLKNLNPEKVQGYVDINAFDSGVFLEAPITEDLSVAISGRRSYIDAIIGAVVPDNAPVNVVAAPRYYDYQLLMNWRPHPDHNVRLFMFGSDDTLELLFENPKDLDVALQSGDLSTTSAFYRAILTHDWTVTEKLKHRTQVAFGKDMLDFSLGDQLYFDLDTWQLQFRNEFRYDLSENITLVAGQDIVSNWTDISIRLPRPPQEGDADFNREGLNETIDLDLEGDQSYQPAAYVQTELRAFDKKLLVIPEGRVDYTRRSKEWTFDPRVRVRYDFNKQWATKGGVGLFHQEPPPQETAIGFGNPNVFSEEAIHYSLGAEYRPWEFLLIDTTFFYKDMRDLVSRSDIVDPNGEAENLNNGGLGRVYGMDLLIRHEFNNNFFGWVSYTLSRAERRDFGETEYRLFDFDQTHILNVIGSYRLGNNWEVGARWRFVSGNPTTPVIGGAFSSDRDEYDPIVGEANSARLPAFHQMDLRIDKRWIYDTWTLNAYLDIQNVYNQSNVEGFQYSFDYSQQRPQQGLPVLPILGVKSEF